ncbi:hypothetical protein AB0C34_22535 [Nocardia sp. NPDC049220]|uniref:hypothetical protein n=1 Tax=Nocardia sp. NPDC049220 TaxID=3155273 RepID=UPI0033F5EC04
MSHSCVADASLTSGLAGRAELVPGIPVAEAVVELELPVGAGLESLPHAVSAAAANTPAISSVLREIQRLCGIGTSARVGLVRIESAIFSAPRPVPGGFRPPRRCEYK